jgi:hypothetical protein
MWPDNRGMIMGFRENLLQKIQIDRLSRTVRNSMGPPDSGRRIDGEAMRTLVEMGGYRYQKERDLDLYFLNAQEILVLDNELKIYRTTAEDIGLRKSPTVKEMVSIRNAIKILNDKNVVVSRKADTLERIKSELISALDLSFTAADIASLAGEGSQALENRYADGVIEILTLFAELLGFQEAPKVFQIAHHRIWGRLVQAAPGAWRFGPVVLFGLMDNALKLIRDPVDNQDEEQLQLYQRGKLEALSGDTVWGALKETVIKEKTEEV